MNVTKTGAEVADPLVAVMRAVPEMIVVMDDVATPAVVVAEGSMLPWDVVNATEVPFTTGLLYWSLTVAVSWLVLPTASEVGLACKVTLDGAPGWKVIFTVAGVADPLAALTVAVPA